MTQQTKPQESSHPVGSETPEFPEIRVITAAFVPNMTPKQYADAAGLSEVTVLRQIDRGYIPTVKQGRRRMVNIAAMTTEMIEKNNK